MKQVILLSGLLQVGKTTALARAIEQTRATGGRVAGVLSPPEIVDGEKVGIWIEALDTGERRRLAVAAGMPAAEGSLKTEHWSLDASVTAWGAEVIARACPCDVLVIDELGPLELRRGEGWTVAFDVLREGAYRVAVVVVRAWLVEAMLARLAGMPGVEARVAEVTEANRDALPAEVAGWLEAAG
jgi:nucleoside-triphosphatase